MKVKKRVLSIEEARIKLNALLDKLGEFDSLKAQFLLDGLIADPHRQLERAMDLVRYQRGELFDGGLIDQTEYAALVADSENGQRVARLEGYDRIRKELEQAREEIERLAVLIDRVATEHDTLCAYAGSLKKEDLPKYQEAQQTLFDTLAEIRELAARAALQPKEATNDRQI